MAGTETYRHFINGAALVRRGVRSPAAGIYAAMLVSQALGLVITVAMARLLSVREFGTLTEVLIWVGVLSLVLSCGVPDALIVTAGSEPEQIRRVFSAGAGYYGTLALFAAVAMWLLGQVVLDTSASLALIMVVIVLVGFVATFIASLEQCLGVFVRYSWILVLTNVLTLLLLIPIALRPNWCTVGVLLGVRLVGDGTVVLSRLYHRRDFVRVGPAGRAGVRGIARSGARFHATSLLSVLASRLDQIMATHYLSVAALGAYGAVLPMSTAMRGLGSAVSSVGLVQLTATRGSPGQAAVLSRQVRIGGLGMLAVVAPLGLICVLGLPRLYGEKYDIAWSALLQVVGGALYSLVDLQIRLLRGLDIVWPGIVARVAAIACVGLVGPFLLSRYGVLGAGYLSLVTGGLALCLLSAARYIAVARKVSYLSQELV